MALTAGRSASRLGVLALLLGSVVAAGCADPGESLPPEWKGRDLREPGWANATVVRGWTMGLEYVWSSGQAVEWDWLTNGTTVVYFQVMRMDGDRPQTLVAQHRNNSTGSITVPQAGAHQVFFRNEGFWDAQVWYKLPEGAALRFYPPGQQPDCFYLALAPC